jgi:hypothetical protein
MLLKTTCTDGIEKTQSAEAIDISCIFGHFEGDFDVGLGTEIVDLGGLDLCDDVYKIGTVAQVTVVKYELVVI